jgi:hypothetical protein
VYLILVFACFGSTSLPSTLSFLANQVRASRLRMRLPCLASVLHEYKQAQIRIASFFPLLIGGSLNTAE